MDNIVKRILLFVLKLKNRRLMINDLIQLFANNKNVENSYIEGENLHVRKWKRLDKRVSPMTYRFYSNYIGQQVNIVPADTSRQFIEPILNCGDCDKFYSDKNSFGLFIDPNDMPKTIFRSIGYKLYDGEYNAVIKDNFEEIILSYDQLIVKPAKDLGGHGIVFFERKNDILINENNEILTIDYLERVHKTDFLIQECFVQSEFMSQFNPSSVNTIRLNTYRDVNNGAIHILGAALRIGAKGAKVDNATSGGVIIGIDDIGKIGYCAYDKYGHKKTFYNDIDFSKNDFIIPNFEGVKNFAIKITKRLPHMSLLALDVVLDRSNTPKLIEVNSNSFSVKFLQLTKQPVFGEFTDDIIDYCIRHKNRLSTGIHFSKKN